MGFSEVWSSQIFGPDTLTAIALVGREVPDLDFGTGVIPIQPRHPAMLAAQARTVEGAIGGHLSLGVGLSHQVVVEGMWGIDFSRPGTYMREYLEALGPMLRGERVDFHGERVTAVTLGEVGPQGVGEPSLLVAALGPKMLEAAGALTDGTVLWMTGRETVRTHIAPRITEAAAAAGRKAPRIVCSLPVTVTTDVAGARQRNNEAYAIYPTLPSYAAMLAKEGAAEPADVALIGSREHVREMIGEVEAAGVTEFSGGPTGTRQEREDTLELLAELAK
jgi:F420-dependent oxidoreductase-like protein